MPFFVYFVVLLITGGTVLFGLDWLSAPMSPMPPIKPVIVAKAPPPAPAPAPRVETNVEGVVTPPPVMAPQSSPAATAAVVPPAVPAPIPPAAVDTSVPSIMSEAPGDSASVDTAVAEERPSPKCDVNACTVAYRSFTAADCTYQPVFGPRRLCTRGVVPNDAANVPDTAATSNARAAAQCNVNACAAAYVSFNATDCTYQPMNGPRRLCEK